MAQRSHLNVFCFGHSFVRHFRNFNRVTPSNNGFPSINLAFSPEEFHVAYYGLSGGTVSIDKGRLLQNELGRFTTIGPDIVFLDIGSNDLCSPEVTPERLATDIQKIADFLVIGHGVQVVVIGAILPRLNTPNAVPDYNDRVAKANSLLQSICDERVCLQFCKHEKMGCNATDLYYSDGIHLSTVSGYPKYFRSVRGAILRARKLILQQRL